MSSEPIAIEAADLSKVYYHTPNPLHQLAGALGLKRHGEPLSALAPLSFTIRRGESVGIVGQNGSGKSTLLSLIAGTSTPSSGHVKTHGRVVALLELGSGFDPEYSGRDNVYMNGHILGLSKKEIDARFDAITEFADIGQSIDRPVKTYSSGMQMRLAFAVAAHTNADILIIDESLSVGDAAFVQKCMRFLRSFAKRGTLLFVSHDLGAVKALCKRAIWLDKSILKQDGPAKQVGDAYLAWLYGTSSNKAQQVQKNQAIVHETRLKNYSPTPSDVTMQGFEFNPHSEQFGDGAAELLSIEILSESGETITHMKSSTTVHIRICARAKETLRAPILGFYVRNAQGQPLFGSNSCARHEERPPLTPQQTLEANFHFTMPRLTTGTYTISASIASGTMSEHIQHDWQPDSVVFEVTASPFNHGLVDILMDRVVTRYIETKQEAI